MRRPVGPIVAHPHTLGILTEPLSLPGTSSGATSGVQAEEGRVRSTGPSATRQATVVEELSDSEDEGEPEEQHRRLMSEKDQHHQKKR